MKELVIVSAVRTAIGSFGGSLKDISAIDLGSIVVKEALNRAGIIIDNVDEVILGNVLQSGLGQNPARQSAVKAGIPIEVPSMTINKACGSGLRAVSLACQIIKAGDADIIIAGGMENMSRSPFLLNDARWGYNIGNNQLIDEMIVDGLWDSFNQYHMGVTAENIAEQWGITREMQDEFALNSQQKAEAAIKSGRFEDEIIPVDIKEEEDDITFKEDELPSLGMTIEELQELNPIFKEGGTVTSGNISDISDGAAALVIMAADKAAELNIDPLAKVVSYGSKGLDPSIMGYGSFHATKQVLDNGNLTIDDIDLIEANETFASQSLAVAQDLNFDMNKVNVNGGSIALGNPIGASGARILVSLLYEMKKRDLKRGLATICIGGGMGTSLIVERD